MEEILRKLQDKNDKAAYEFAKQIGAESIVSDKYSDMIPAFAEMLRDKSSYVRTRGFVLMQSGAVGKRRTDGGSIRSNAFDVE